jgi:hypothetical protein
MALSHFAAMRDHTGIGKGIGIFLSAPVDAGKILLDKAHCNE